MAEVELSVVVPAYNVGGYIDRCVESVLRQDCAGMELLLVDDGSTDDTGRRCDVWAERDVRVRIVHRPNGGLAAARNEGIERARGEVLFFLDGDDYLAEGILPELRRAKAAHRAQIACCRMRRVRDSNGGAPVRPGTAVELLNRTEALARMLRQSDITNSACAKLCDRSLFSGVRFPEGELFEDLATTYRIFARAERTALLRAPGYCYRARPGSIQLSAFTPEKCAELRFAREQKAYLDARFPELRSATSDRLVSCCFHELFSLPEGAYPRERAELAREIRKRRLGLILDARTSPKTRLGCLASFLGLARARRLYERLGVRGRLFG